MSNITFAELGISPAIIEALTKKGYEEPSKIQALVIPEFLKQQSNIIGQAQTGTGKTAAFSIPIIDTLVPDNGNTKALILTPTRELANQVSDEIYSLIGKANPLKVYPVYGGQSIDQQIKNIKRGADVIVGTPGRIIDLLERKVLNLKHLEYFVLDEADEMLNMGFVDAIEEILKQTNKQQRMLFFSATMPPSILTIAKKYMGEFKILKVENKEATTNLTEQIYFEVRESEKFDTLCRVLDFEREFYGIVFARTKHETDDITARLKSRGYSAEALHGDITQTVRNKTLSSFKSRKINILVATDVAARGIDVNNLTHVINYSVPAEAESYIHRIGRTGRAGNKGIAITFITQKDAYHLTRIQRMTKTSIKRQVAPSVTEVIKAKKETLEACVSKIVSDNDYKDYLNLAKEILADREAEVITAAILRHAYGDEFLVQNYVTQQTATNSRKSEVTSRGNSDGARFDDQTRLFVALGKRDGYNPKKLLELLSTECKTPARKVKDIRILDNFSFISVPFDEAEIILKTINSNDRKKPLISRAKK